MITEHESGAIKFLIITYSMKTIKVIKIKLLFIFLALYISSSGQYIDPIKTHVPYLSVTPYPGIGSMADISVVGTHSSLNNYAFYANPALNNRINKLVCADVSLMPVSFKGISDNYISQFGLTYALNKKNSLSLSGLIYKRYLYSIWSLNTPELKDFIIRGKYSYAINEHWALGLAGKYFFSDSYQSIVHFSSSYDRVHSYAFDLGASYENKFYLFKHKYSISIGATLCDFGPKITYEIGEHYKDNDFISTKLLLGGVISTEIEQGFNFYLAYQLEKQLVPTFNEINIHPGNQDLTGSDNTPFEALYKSFFDADGGFSEEMSELVHKFGIEILWDLGATAYLSIRAGCAVNKHANNLNSYGTVGIGIGFLGFDISAKALTDNFHTSYYHSVSLGYRISLARNRTYLYAQMKN